MNDFFSRKPIAWDHYNPGNYWKSSFGLNYGQSHSSYIVGGLITDYINRQGRELADTLLDHCADLAQLRDGELSPEVYGTKHAGARVPIGEEINDIIKTMSDVAKALYRVVGAYQ